MVDPEPAEPMTMISFRVSASELALVRDVKALCESGPPGAMKVSVNRSDLLRLALRRGLEAIKQERQAPPTKRKGKAGG